MLIVKERGIALFQILVMVSVLSILLLIMTAFSQQSVRQAKQLLDHTNDELELYSAFNQLNFRLLTNQWQGEGTGETLYYWNFYGKDFVINITNSSEKLLNVPAQMQDLNSLISIKTPREDLLSLLRYLNFPEGRAVQMFHSVIEAQKKPAMLLDIDEFKDSLPHLPFYHVTELVGLEGWDKTSVEIIQPYVTMHSDRFNPVNVPDKLLPALLPEAHAAIIQRLRQEGTFNATQFGSVTGIFEDDIISFSLGNGLKITLRHPDSSLMLQSEIRINPYLGLPLLIYNQHYGADERQTK